MGNVRRGAERLLQILFKYIGSRHLHFEKYLKLQEWGTVKRRREDRLLWKPTLAHKNVKVNKNPAGVPTKLNRMKHTCFVFPLHFFFQFMRLCMLYLLQEELVLVI